jgi:hypothetical protein
MSRAHGAGVNLGTLGDQGIFQMWSDFGNVTLCVTETLMTHWTGIFQDLTLGRGREDRLPHDIVAFWRAWFSGMATLGCFPIEWVLRRGVSAPNIVFMIDQAAQTAPPVSAPTPVNVSGLMLASTDLQRVNGAESIPAGKVVVEERSRGNRVEVTLVDLGSDAQGNNLAAGLYAGVAYAYERPYCRPLALVYVYVTPPSFTGPAPNAGGP